MSLRRTLDNSNPDEARRGWWSAKVTQAACSPKLSLLNHAANRENGNTVKCSEANLWPMNDIEMHMGKSCGDKF